MAKPVRRHSLRLRMNNHQRNAWNTVIPLITAALTYDDVPGEVLRRYRLFKTRNPEGAATLRARTPWFDELLTAIGE